MFKNDKIVTTDIFDFDNPRFHVPPNIGRKIAEIDKKKFSFYLTALDDFHLMESSHSLNLDNLIRIVNEIDQKFIQCFNTYSATGRVLIFFDTIEALPANSDLWNYLTEMGKYLRNYVIIIAGRNVEEKGNKLKQIINNTSIHIINLPKFGDNEKREYIKQKSKNEKICLSEAQMEFLFRVADRPIFIDLAVEWITRNISIDCLTNFNRLTDFSDKELEKQLVIHIAQTRTEIDKLILLLSHVYPLDEGMIAELLYKNEGTEKAMNKAHHIFSEAKTYVFIKSLPDGNIKLHDEMQRLIKDYVWEKVDPESRRRTEYSKISVKYFNEKIQTVFKEIENQQSNIHKMEFEQELLLLKAEFLKHSLIVDINDGVNIFLESFDKATRSNQFLMREILIKEMSYYIDQLSFEQLYQFNSRRVEHHRNTGYFSQAKEIISEYLENNELSPEHRVEMLIKEGNIQIRLGDYYKGIDFFKEAVDICEKNKFDQTDPLKHILMQAKNALGWGYRKIGNYDKAIEEYDYAHTLSISLNDEHEEARILNNLAYAHAKNDNTVGASYLAEEAKKKWNKIKVKEEKELRSSYEEGLGSLYHVYSYIYRLNRNFENAISYADHSIKIFEKLGNKDWSYRSYLQKGFCYLRRAEFNSDNPISHTVEDDLHLAEDNIKNVLNSQGEYRIDALHYLGHVYYTRSRYKNGENLDKSQKYFEEAYDESTKASFNIAQLNSLGDLTNIAREKREFEKLDDFKTSYEKYIEKWRRKGYPKEYDGLLLKYFGDFHLIKEPCEAEEAIDYYMKGLPLIAMYGHWTLFDLPSQLRNIEHLLNSKKELAAVKIELGKKLFELWNNDNVLAKSHPEARSYFIRWQKGESQNA